MVADARFTITAHDKTKAAFKSIERALNGTVAAMSSVQAQIGALVGVAGFGALVNSQINVADKAGKVAEKLGLTTEALTELRYAAARASDMTGDTFDMALQRMTRRLAEAAQGTGEAVKALEELGLDAQRLARLSPDRAFREIAEAMQDVESQSDKVRLAFKFFDSEGVGLVNTLNLGKDGLDDMAKSARDLGIVIDEETARKAAEFNDNLADLKASADGLGITVAEKTLPALNRITKAMTEAAKESGVLWSLWVGLGGLGSEVRDVVTGGEEGRLQREIDSLSQSLSGFNKQLAEHQRIANNPNLLKVTRDQAQAEADRLQNSIAALNISLSNLEERKRQLNGTEITTIEIKKGRNVDEDPHEQDRVNEAEWWQWVIDGTEDFYKELRDQAERQRAFDKAMAQQRIATVSTMFANVATLVSSENRKLFEIGKAAAIAETVVNTYSAAQKQFDLYGSTPLAYAAAAAAVVAGLARVQAIQNTSFGGGGSGGVGNTGSGVSSAQDPVGPAPTLPQNQQPTGTTQIIVVGNRQLSGSDIDLLLEEARSAIEGGDQVLIDVNSRNGQQLVDAAVAKVAGGSRT